MTKHNLTQTTLPRTSLRVRRIFSGLRLERLLALVHEWRTHRRIERSLCQLSDFQLRDVGLIKADVEAACANGFDRPASRALKSAAQSRIGNW